MTYGSGIGSGQNDPAWLVEAKRRLAATRQQAEQAALGAVNRRGAGIMAGLRNISRNVRSIVRR